MVELFYQTTARKIIISQIYSQQQGALMLHWSHMMASVVHLLTQLLYPSSGLSCCALCFDYFFFFFFPSSLTPATAFLAVCLQPSPPKALDFNLLIKKN